jgi:hypothetical protein
LKERKGKYKSNRFNSTYVYIDQQIEELPKKKKHTIKDPHVSYAKQIIILQKKVKDWKEIEKDSHV